MILIEKTYIINEAEQPYLPLNNVKDFDKYQKDQERKEYLDNIFKDLYIDPNEFVDILKNKFIRQLESDKEEQTSKEALLESDSFSDHELDIEKIEDKSDLSNLYKHNGILRDFIHENIEEILQDTDNSQKLKVELAIVNELLKNIIEEQDNFPSEYLKVSDSPYVIADTVSLGIINSIVSSVLDFKPPIEYEGVTAPILDFLDKLDKQGDLNVVVDSIWKDVIQDYGYESDDYQDKESLLEDILDKSISSLFLYERESEAFSLLLKVDDKAFLDEYIYPLLIQVLITLDHISKGGIEDISF